MAHMSERLTTYYLLLTTHHLLLTTYYLLQRADGTHVRATARRHVPHHRRQRSLQGVALTLALTPALSPSPSASPSPSPSPTLTLSTQSPPQGMVLQPLRLRPRVGLSGAHLPRAREPLLRGAGITRTPNTCYANPSPNPDPSPNPTPNPSHFYEAQVTQQLLR